MIGKKTMNLRFEFMTWKEAEEELSLENQQKLRNLYGQVYGNEQSCNLKFGFKMFDYDQDEVDLDDIEYVAMAFDGETLIGAILAYQGEYGYFPDSTYIDACVIDNSYRGQGIGSKLMKFFDQKVKEAGIKIIVLHVNKNNQNAQGLYASRGYQQIGIVMAKQI